MGNIRRPRHGSLQFWPRKRAKHSIARIRSWPSETKTKPLGFISYKAGMTHVIATDNRPKSLTKGEQIAFAATILECPPNTVAGVCFYRNTPTGWQKFSTIMAPKFVKEIDRAIPLPKKSAHSFNDIKEYDDVRLLVHTNPQLTTIGSKKPQLVEIALGGNKEEKLKYAQTMLGKEIPIADVFQAGNQVDVHGISKGKGVQGTVKRYGIPIRSHKAEKTKRGIATLGGWTPKRVHFSVAQAGKMGYHLRTEYNKHILKIGTNGAEVTPVGGMIRYGVIKNQYLLVKGSVVGPKKRTILLTPPSRPNMKIPKEAPEISHISQRN